MKILISFFASLFISIVILRAESASMSVNDLQKKMQPSQGVMGEKYSQALDAYVRLMNSGKQGFEILANSWVSDQIPEEDWLQWQDDFLLRYGKGVNNKKMDAYYEYLNQRYQKDDSFALLASKRLAGTKVYPDQALADWLKGPSGQRRVAYMALKQRHPDVPPFEFSAADKVRERQLLRVREFLNLK